MPFASSQGLDLIAGATKVSIKKSRPSPVVPKLDSSTLELEDGATRTYEDGLKDKGPTGEIVVVVTANGLGSKPAVGSTIEVDGTTCKCMESTDEATAGELQAWSASYTSDFTEPA